jgi:hypothetical protein
MKIAVGPPASMVASSMIGSAPFGDRQLAGVLADEAYGVGHGPVRGHVQRGHGHVDAASGQMVGGCSSSSRVT